MVVSGAPEVEHDHAEKVCDMALDMVDAITDLKDPSTGITHIDKHRLFYKLRRLYFNVVFRELITNKLIQINTRAF